MKKLSDIIAWALIVAVLFALECIILIGPDYHPGVSSYAKGYQVNVTGKQWGV